MNIPSLLLHFCDAIWEYRISTNEVFFHYDNTEPMLCGQWLSYAAVEQRYQENYVHPLDIAIWKRYLTPEALRRFYDGAAAEEHFYIRLENPHQGHELHEVYLQKMEEGRLFLASRDMQEIQRTSSIAKAVVPEFDYVACIDLLDKSYVLYYSDANKTIVPENVSDNYDWMMKEYNGLHVIPEEVESLNEQMELEYVLKKLEEKEEYIVYATMQDKGRVAYKKLRFSYADENRKRLFLTRTDVGMWMRERKLREQERGKRLKYLENMPVAFCSTKILLDDTGKPYDFQFTYCNKAHEELEGVQPGELIGKNFYEFFEETDPTWLQYYYETAYYGIPHVLRRYSPEIQKHLLIYTFQSDEIGCCECALLDVSEEHFLVQELEYSREIMKRILTITTDEVFQYFPEREEIILIGRAHDEQQVLSRETLHNKLIDEKLLHPDYQGELHAAFLKIKSGEHTVSLVVRGRLNAGEAWNWLRVTMFDFLDGYTHERRVLGFLQNIDEDRSREEELQKKAEQDSLTKVLNAGTGKERITRLLEMSPHNAHVYHAMFVMDLDDFKTVNDTQGHIVGDKVLVAFARILRQTFRAEDIIYRLGGDEFVVFVEKLHDTSKSVASMLHRLKTYMESAQTEYPFIACSVGVIVTNRDRSFEECYQMADQALYEAKRNGKGRFHIAFDVSEQEEN